MSRFYVKQIVVSGSEGGVIQSKIEFTNGVNIIHGPSNTGKSYVVSCLNFMFGAKETPFSKASTKYDTVSVTFESDDGNLLTCKRMIIEGNSGETGSNVMNVTASTLTQFPTGDYYVNSERKDALPYNNLLLYLMGIQKVPKIISNKKRDPSNFTIRTIFQFFFLDEDHIFKKPSVFINPHFNKPTAIIMSLLYLLEGKDYNDLLPEESELVTVIIFCTLNTLQI